MRSSHFKYALVMLALISLSFSYWGFEGHKMVNENAIYALPPDLFSFYKEHNEFIRESAIDADQRKHSDPEEGPKHYIDIDYYSVDGKNPFNAMPRGWKLASERYSEDTLKAYGILPWNTLWVFEDLVDAFKEKNKDEILRLSADLGHYIADAHVPLHTTLNYDGQLTGQRGIHAFWESRLVELYGKNFSLGGIKARYIEYPKDFIWDIIMKSHIDLPIVLEAEKMASASLSDNQKYTYVERNGKDELQPSETFALAFYQNQGNLVESRMQKSIEAVASLWLTAWVVAGQPDLFFEE